MTVLQVRSLALRRLPTSLRTGATSSSLSTLLAADSLQEEEQHSEIRRLSHLRNVGILAHVDAGKTTVSERMLALAGVIREAGSVDDGSTVTDYLPAERERGITIQSAAISFEWGWHNHYIGNDYDANDSVTIQLIDTPGHVDFSLEVNRSVAVLDGAVLVLDAVAGVQAQTETVWRAMTRPSLNNHLRSIESHAHEPLPALALINKMDKEGRSFVGSMHSIRQKLPNANPMATQLPLFSKSMTSSSSSRNASSPESSLSNSPWAKLVTEAHVHADDFVGVVDLIHMRAVLYPASTGKDMSVEDSIPTTMDLLDSSTLEPLYPDCDITERALQARAELVMALADVDSAMEEFYLLEEEPTNAELRAALRRATLAKKALPVLAGAGLKSRGVEPLLDSIADLLPSPLDRQAPALTQLDDSKWKKKKLIQKQVAAFINAPKLGHALHSNMTLALAFKVVHMKGRGGSGSGRVVFCRVYSGSLKERDTVTVMTPPSPGEAPSEPRTERIGGMLELAGGRFDNLTQGHCQSGDVCALVGLRTVVTGDTLLLSASKSNKAAALPPVCLAGVAAPKPVLTVRVEAETMQGQNQLSAALELLVIEDPSLVVKETESATTLSGLGELHIEVTLDRLAREFGLNVMTGPPAVAYRESLTDKLETDGLCIYDKTIGSTRLEAGIHIILEPKHSCEQQADSSSCMLLSDPTVSIGPEAREFLNVDPDMPEESLAQLHDLVNTLIVGAKGAMRRGAIGSYALANVHCHVVNISSQGGLSSLQATPGAIRAAAANAIAELLHSNSKLGSVLLEPQMSVEVTLPSDQVGVVLSDLNTRRGTVGDVLMGEAEQSKALVRGEVPLSEILGYANSLRSLTAGEGSFSAEYKGHSPCEIASIV